MGNAACVALFHRAEHIPSALLDQWLCALSDIDQQRAANMRSASRREAFIVARALLSALFERKLGKSAQIISLASQQPALADSAAHCSLSHSAGMTVAGFSEAAPIGVDIEQMRPRRFTELVHHYFHPDEVSEFEQVDKHQRSDWFYRHWTSKEAHAKASGQGVTVKTLATLSDEKVQHTTIDTQNARYSLSVYHGATTAIDYYHAALDLPAQSFTFTQWNAGAPR